MKYLSQFSPAEATLLLKGNSTHKELLKITLADLILKKVLRIFEVQRQLNIRQKVRVYKYIGVGVNFNLYQAKPHEEFFLRAFRSDRSIEIQFRNVVKIGYQNSGSYINFKKVICRSKDFKNCISQNFIQKLLGNFTLNREGNLMMRNIRVELQDLSKKLATSADFKNKKFAESIILIGASILLVENIDYEFLSSLDADLTMEMSRKYELTDAGSGCSGCGFDHNYSSDFDSGCSSDSGCSGGSGCSGCGGCGGCGGCS